MECELSDSQMCSNLLWLKTTGGGARVFESPRGIGKTSPGALARQTPTWSSIDFMMATTYGVYSPMSRLCQEQAWSGLIPSITSYSTTNSSVDGIEVRATTANQALHINEAEPADNDDADADVDSEAGSDRWYLSESESDSEEGTIDDDENERDLEELEPDQWYINCDAEDKYAPDDDTVMTNLDVTSSQQNIPSAITDRKKKPRRCKLSRKRFTSLKPPGLVPDMDIEMDIPDGEEPNDYYNDSSADEDDSYVYASWFKEIYHPMWLGNASASGKKRRDNVEEDGGITPQDTDNTSESIVAEIAKRHIKQPSLSRRKRAWKESRGTNSSIAESEWSLQPMPPPGSIPSPPITPTPIAPLSPKQMHIAPRSTQSRHRQNSGRILERRLGNLHADMSYQNSIDAPTTLANDSQPRLSSDRHEQKRPRYLQTASFEVANMDTSTGGTEEIHSSLFWDSHVEEPMDFRSSEGNGNVHFDASGLDMMSGVEASMNMNRSVVPGQMMGVFVDRGRHISRVLEDVQELLES